MSLKSEHVYEIFIQSTPERIWQALTDPDMTQRYYFGTRIESDFAPGTPYVYVGPDGTAMLGGETWRVSRRDDW